MHVSVALHEGGPCSLLQTWVHTFYIIQTLVDAEIINLCPNIFWKRSGPVIHSGGNKISPNLLVYLFIQSLLLNPATFHLSASVHLSRSSLPRSSFSLPPSFFVSPLSFPIIFTFDLLPSPSSLVLSPQSFPPSS